MFSLANLGFQRDDVRVITDENPWDLPTAENIVRSLRCPCEMSFVVTLTFGQMEAMAALVYDAQPNDSLLLYCTGFDLGSLMYIDNVSH